MAEQNQQLLDLNQGLERKVAERTEELKRALGASEKANAALRQQHLLTVKAFAGLIDLRNPRLGAHCRQLAGMEHL